MKGSVIISDNGGSGDKLKLNGAKKGNLVFMVDYSKYAKEGYEGCVDSGNLIIFDKTTKGFVEIKDYFSMESSYIRYTNADRIKPATADGCIETIYAGKSNITNTMFNQLTGAKIEAISADVANWLSDTNHTYSSVSELLNYGQSTDLNNFIATLVQQ